MQSSNLKALVALVCLLVLGGTLIAGTGCGSSGDTTAAQVKRVAANKQPQTPQSKLARYMKRRFGKESWYPLVTDIDELSGGSAVIVETELTNHETPGWNEKQAGIMCRAFLTSPAVETAQVLWNARTTYEVFSC